MFGLPRRGSTIGFLYLWVAVGTELAMGTHLFSSSELCSGWAIVINFCPPSVRPSVSNDFSEAAEPVLFKFHMEPP